MRFHLGKIVSGVVNPFATLSRPIRFFSDLFVRLFVLIYFSHPPFLRDKTCWSVASWLDSMRDQYRYNHSWDRDPSKEREKKRWHPGLEIRSRTPTVKKDNNVCFAAFFKKKKYRGFIFSAILGFRTNKHTHTPKRKRKKKVKVVLYLLTQPLEV